MSSKYSDEIASARADITAAGALVTWYKNGQLIDDALPQFPEDGEPTAFPDVPIVFTPKSSLTDQTIVQDPTTQSQVVQLYGLIPGDVEFTPEYGDAVKHPDGSALHCIGINVVAPDGVAIIYEVSLK